MDEDIHKITKPDMMESDKRKTQNNGSKKDGEIISRTNSTPDNERGENDDNLTKTAITEKVSPENNKCINVAEQARQYNFKIVLEALQESSNVFLAQSFTLFFKKMIVMDPHLMIISWKETPRQSPLQRLIKSQDL